MTKNIAIPVTPPRARPQADAWVASGSARGEGPPKHKRLTVDMDPALHARFKAHCAVHGLKMGNEVIAWIRRVLADTPS